MLVEGRHYKTVWMEDGKVKMIEQNMLPHKFEIVTYTKVEEVANSIGTMVVRGAGAIGAAAGFGVALAALNASDAGFEKELSKGASLISSTRPTAQNLFYAVERVLKATKDKSPKEARESALKEAQAIADEDSKMCESIGEHGAKLLKDGMKVNTHCNAGWLAFTDWGSALSPVYKAKRQDKDIFVFADETRPRCQGAKLTAWELLNEGVEHAVIADNAAGYFMKRGEIDAVIVGSDRTAANGDVANKIGTYSSAVVAKENGIPFYVAIPLSTLDPKMESGGGIPIEERDEDEVRYATGREGPTLLTPEGSHARNPAFDVTPAEMITGIITPKGVFKPEKIMDALK